MRKSVVRNGDTVTLWVPEPGSPPTQRTYTNYVLECVKMDQTKGYNTLKTGHADVDSIRLSIYFVDVKTYSADDYFSENKPKCRLRYTDPMLFTGLSPEKRVSCWTVLEESLIMPGAINHSGTVAELLDTYSGLWYKAKSVDVKNHCSKRMRHIEVSGGS